MKGKKVLVLTLAMALWGGTMIFADSATQAVKVMFNGSELQETGIMSDGKTYLPLRQVAQKMQALVVWDDSSKKASIIRPNVHMVLFDKDNSPFGYVKNKGTTSFSLLAQVDSLAAEVDSFRITITDPAGKETALATSATKKDNFFYLSKEIKYGFDSSGTYAIRFSLRLSPNDDWSVVSEKNITVG
ncbi:stalk domain-containing protein [Paenibacillus sp. D51F]